MTNYASFHRADELETQLEEDGLPPVVSALIMRATARSRHEWRMCETFRAAWGWVTDDIPPVTSVTDIRAAFASIAPAYRGAVVMYMLMDYIGTGGHCGAGGVSASTSRIMEELGKGRRWACDGGAWMAALRDVIVNVMDSSFITLTPQRDGSTFTILITSSGAGYNHPLVSGTRDFSLTTVDPFMQSLARRAILQPLGLIPELEHLFIEFGGTSADWAVLLGNTDCEEKTP